MDDALAFHTRFSPQELDAQYNLRAGRPDYEETVISKWEEASKAARNQGTGEAFFNVRYGDGKKQVFDLFSCDQAQAPTLVYFHGGYWQRGDKSIYSFIAPPFVAAKAHVVIVGYDLCPAVTITQISAQAREALTYLWRHAAEFEINRNRLVVMGHSAGGHLTQMMMATDWPRVGSDLPADLVKAGLPISPLSYLEPIRLTEALNAGIGMDAAEAEAQSPMTQHPPATNAPQLLIVGGAETAEFHRQARIYVETYKTNERSLDLYVVPGVDHFDELDVLVDPNSPVFQHTCSMLFGRTPDLQS